MSATTEATPTIEELHARLADQEREVDEAERAIGAAELDAVNPKAATKRLVDAQAAAQRTRGALAELERRDRERERHELELTAARERQEAYRWASVYMAGVIEVQRLQDELRAAADRLGEISKGITRGIAAVKSPGLGRPVPWDVEALDGDLIRSLPNGQMSRFPIRGFKDLPEKGWSAAPDQLEARITRARELAEQEAAKIAELEDAGGSR